MNSEYDDEDEDASMEKYEREQQIIEEMCPNAKFEIAIQLEYLDDVVSVENLIIIKHKYDCYCYDNVKPKKTKYFCINGNGNAITNKFIIKNLIKQKLSLKCNHTFVEGFHKLANSNCQYEIMTGS